MTDAPSEPAPPCPECGVNPLYRGHCGLCGYDAPLPEPSVLSAEETIERLAWELIDKVGIPDLPLALAIAKVAAAAERERCAQVVEEYLIENSATYIPIKIIADAIRRGSR